MHTLTRSTASMYMQAGYCWQVDMHGSQIETERLNGWLGECTSSLPDTSESSLLTKREIWPCNSCVVSSQPTPASWRTTDDASLSCKECLLLGTLIEALPDGFCASSSWVAKGTAFAAGRSHFCNGQTYLTSSINASSMNRLVVSSIYLSQGCGVCRHSKWVHDAKHGPLESGQCPKMLHTTQDRTLIPSGQTSECAYSAIRWLVRALWHASQYSPGR